MHEWILLIQLNLRTQNKAFRIEIFNEEEKTKFHFDSTEFYKDKDDADDIQLLYDSYNKLEKNSVVELMHNLHKTFLESEN
jgi:hypothetical protein